MDDGDPGLKSDLNTGSILSRTARGAGWTIGWRLTTRLIGFCSTLILVRLLTPEDFGIVSLASGFFQAMDSVAGFGVEGAIIRADRADRAIYDAGFTVNIVRGALTCIVLIGCATPVSRFFDNAHLVVISSVIRPATAVGIMAATLSTAGLGWTDWDGDNAALGVSLAGAVGLGAVVYLGSLTALWFAMGRPAGAEADAVSAIGRLTRAR